jgi:oxaloacetate decarboxylase beta subunit
MGLEKIVSFFSNSGFAGLEFGNVVMIGIGLLIITFSITKKAEPLLLITLGFGMILANIPPHLTGILNAPAGDQPGGLLWYLKQGMELGIYPPLIFLGIGATTDFSYLIANPKLILLGAAAQIGIFLTFIVSSALGFSLKEAASIGIIGGADGPSAIYLATLFSPELLSVIAIAAYTYISFIPILQPPISRLLTTKEERLIKMKRLRNVSQAEKIIFPVLTTVIIGLIVPQALSLVGMLMLGNLLKENKLTGRLVDACSKYILDTVTILLMLSVGTKATADVFLTTATLKIIVLGVAAFIVAFSSGILFAKFLNLFSKDKINPLIGAAGVSAVPIAARVSQQIAQKEDPSNFILMHAMGPNVAGVIGSAVAVGVFINLIGM